MARSFCTISGNLLLRLMLEWFPTLGHAPRSPPSQGSALLVPVSRYAHGYILLLRIFLQQ